jgi:hypothetical protein
MFDIQVIDAIVATVRLTLEVMSVPGLLTDLVQQASGHLVEATNISIGVFLEPASVSAELLEAATGAVTEVSVSPLWETLSVSNPSLQ